VTQTGEPEETGPILDRERLGGPLGVMERAAREAVNRDTGRCLSDTEWGEARSKLLAFGVILRGWDRGAKNHGRKVGNVDAICQQEL